MLSDILIKASKERPIHDAVVTDTALCYQELEERSYKLANALISSKMEPGDRIAIHMDNTTEWVVAFFGILLAGCIVVAVDRNIKSSGLSYVLTDSGSKMLLTEGIVKLIVDNPKANPVPTPSFEVEDALILYTSGSTGNPKGVLHTHKSLWFALSSINYYLDTKPSDRLFCVLPLHHGYGLFQMLAAIHQKATVVLQDGFLYHAKAFAKMNEQQVTCFAGTPTLFSMLISHNEKSEICFPSVRMITNAAAALPEEYVSPLKKIFPNAVLYKMYGQAECIRATYLPPNSRKKGSVGFAIPGTSVIVLDNNLAKVAAFENGILYVRGLHVMKGYWNNPEETKKVLIDIRGKTYLKTGDVFYYDENGMLTFVGREDDLIKCKGEKVYPKEVEDVIYKLPGIKNVIVFGIPDKITGEAIIAIVEKEDYVVTNDVKRLCLEELEMFKIPKIVFSDIPRTDNGKLSRKLSKEQYLRSMV
jgi:acyl-CoA synthetase (AMP-forming)/AMP-acid ligase II